MNDSTTPAADGPVCRHTMKPASECKEHNLHCGAPKCFLQSIATPTPADVAELCDEVRGIAARHPDDHAYGRLIFAATRIEALAAEVGRWKTTATTAIAEAGHWCGNAKRHLAAKEAAEAARDALVAKLERKQVECNEAWLLVAEAKAKVSALEGALAPFVTHYDPRWMDAWPDDAEPSTFSRVTFGQLRAARAALNPPKQGADHAKA